MSAAQRAVREDEISDPTETNRIKAERERFAAFASEKWAQLSVKEVAARFQSVRAMAVEFFEHKIQEEMRSLVVRELWHEWNRKQVVARGDAPDEEQANDYALTRALGKFEDLDSRIQEGEMNDVVTVEVPPGYDWVFTGGCSRAWHEGN